MTFRIQAIHIALLFCLISTFALLPASQARAVVNDVAMVEETVQNFYEKYLKAVQNHLEFDLKKQWEIHPAFAQKIENLIREAEKTEPGFLGYDPILMAQDIPIRLEYEMAGVGTPFAAMLIHKVWGENTKNSLCVYLYKEEGDKRHLDKWQIFEIVDMDDPENSKECSAWENIELLKELKGAQ